MDVLKAVHLSGEDPYYTSDGDEDQISVPWPLPEAQWGELNQEAVHEAGKQLVKYHPDSGKVYVAAGVSNPRFMRARLEDS